MIIAFNQLGNLLGISLEQNNQLHFILIDLADKISAVHPATVIFALAGIAFLAVIKKLNRKLPAGLFLVILGIVLTYFLHLNQQGISIVKDVHS